MRRLVCVALALAFAGCGGGDDKPKRYTVETVVDHFEKQTGDRLRPRPDVSPQIVVLAFPFTRYFTGKYGNMAIFVVNTKDTADSVRAMVDGRYAR
jgi:hypothetical protein